MEQKLQTRATFITKWDNCYKVGSTGAIKGNRDV